MEKESIILIPTLNERKNLEQLIPAIFDLMPEISVLIVDDNSRDGTGELIKNFQSTYDKLFFLGRTENFSYGKACIDGFNKIRRLAMSSNFIDWKYIVTMDADFSHDYRVIPEMLKQLDKYDVVVGSRYVTGGRIENWKLHRRILSKIANFYVRAILGLRIGDLTTGFNAYRKDVLLRVNLNDIKSDGYAFLVELKYKLSIQGASLLEYPITFYERREGQSKMSGKIIWESIRLPWKLL
ncbi:MAG: polyprenol monophosphomannose synthase [bacterium]|nr:polyprenol monophosphomannose synthase [bacterium]